MADSVQNETISRGILAKLLFKSSDINKFADVLSGGERIKLSLAKLLVSSANILLLDEPTNYLDMPSIEVLQSMLRDHEGTVLFVSHDKAFVNAVCTDLLIVKDKKLTAFEGNLDDYDNIPSISPMSKENPRKLLLEHKLAEISGRMQTAKQEDKDALERAYRECCDELKECAPEYKKSRL